jgi:hypothetical protein
MRIEDAEAVKTEYSFDRRLASLLSEPAHHDTCETFVRQHIDPGFRMFLTSGATRTPYAAFLAPAVHLKGRGEFKVSGDVRAFLRDFLNWLFAKMNQSPTRADFRKAERHAIRTVEALVNRCPGRGIMRG